MAQPYLHPTLPPSPSLPPSLLLTSIAAFKAKAPTGWTWSYSMMTPTITLRQNSWVSSLLNRELYSLQGMREGEREEEREEERDDTLHFTYQKAHGFIKDFWVGGKVCGAQLQRYAWVWDDTNSQVFGGVRGDPGLGGQFQRGTIPPQYEIPQTGFHIQDFLGGRGSEGGRGEGKDWEVFSKKLMLHHSWVFIDDSTY